MQGSAKAGSAGREARRGRRPRLPGGGGVHFIPIGPQRHVRLLGAQLGRLNALTVNAVVALPVE